MNFNDGLLKYKIKVSQSGFGVLLKEELRDEHCTE